MMKLATTPPLQVKPQRLELIDGYGRQPAIMVKAGVLETQCAEDQHCVHHGSGPVYPCCKCGAHFKAL